jgi:predicted molibdopterin-dependent oxidoreductase YjgC
MVVRSESQVVLEARQAVLSIINANHSDRCLTCHRRVHCMPGDICLRDSAVTHRCLTCAKNYRCELQTTNEMLQMDNVEPWVGEERTYYESEQPEADRANPFLEFDPQMCIICTRCVRACDEIRHTGAITLAGRGFSTRIAFGAGGPIHESNCDFCGACIDVCPTATLLEKPNKWIAKTETWVSTSCNACSVGCTISMAVRNGRPVMVKPDRLNPVSNDQICVRGRFHYDAIPAKQRLRHHHMRQNEGQAAVPFDVAIETAAERLAGVIKAHGPASVGVLVAPWATNEEAYLAARFAREVIGTENVDSSAGPLADAVADALTGAFGTDVLPSDLTDVATANTIVVIGDDLESSHNIAALRVKDAVVRNGASLIVISSRYGEVCDFVEPPPAGSIMPSPQRVLPKDQMGVWLRPTAGGETATIAALARMVATDAQASGVEGLATLASGPAEAPGVPAEAMAKASSILKRAALTETNKLVVIYAPNPASPRLTGETTKAVANLALACRGDKATSSLFVLPAAPNANGVRDMGARRQGNGLGIDAMLAGGVKALVVVGDNPAMFARGAGVRDALGALDCLITIDSLPTETARLAHVAFADLTGYGKDGTTTSADRRVLRRTSAEAPAGDQTDALQIIGALTDALNTKLGGSISLRNGGAAAVMNAIAAAMPAYADATYTDGSLEGLNLTPERLESGRTRALTATPSAARIQAVALPAPVRDGLVLTTARTLYTSFEGASVLSEEADKLHREEFLEINPRDAADLRIGQNRPVVVSNGTKELTLSAALTDAVAPGSVFLPYYFEGGLVNRLLAPDAAGLIPVTVRPA